MSDSLLCYLYENDQQSGPYTTREVLTMWQAGSISAQTQFCLEGTAFWRPLIELPSMLEAQQGTANVSSPRRKTLLTKARATVSHRVQRRGFSLIFIIPALIAAVSCYILAKKGSLNNIFNRDQTAAFPVGSYKYGTATYITLNSDNTFNVESNDQLLWRCKGTWSFYGKTLSMQADSKSGFMPSIFQQPATLISNGKEIVVWQCSVFTDEWKKIDR